MKQLLLLGTHGQYNIGDELLLESFLHHLNNDFEITVNSYTPKETAEEFNVKTFDTAGSYFEIFKVLMKNDVVLFAGGSILKEMYVAYGRTRHSTLYKVLAIIILARLLGKPVIMACIGIGPLVTRWSKFLTWVAIKLCRHVSVRDRKSFESATELGFNNSVYLVPDIAFSLGIDYWKVKISNERNLSHVNIVLNLCRNIANPENWDYFIENLSKDLNEFHNVNQKIRIIGIPMQISYNGPADHKALEDFKLKFSALNSNIDFSIVKPKSAKEVAHLIHTADLVISERLHLLILSVVENIPFIALEYDVKVTGLLETLGLSEYGVDISKEFKHKTIFKKITLALAQKETFIKKLEKLSKDNSDKINKYIDVLKKNLH